jgi:hypothetical protein
MVKAPAGIESKNRKVFARGPRAPRDQENNIGAGRREIKSTIAGESISTLSEAFVGSVEEVKRTKFATWLATMEKPGV